MKQCLLGLVAALICLALFAAPVPAAGGTLTHIVFVWLKDPDDADAKARFLAASKRLARLPGVIYHRAGSAVPAGHGAGDDDFDVAVTVTLKDRAALEAYMHHPEHQNIVEQVMRPLVKQIRVYDFVSE